MLDLAGGACLLPKRISKAVVPPIKCQGIKTKLVDFLAQNLNWSGEGRWVEPFLGSGVVLFSLCPERALVTDTNEHIIRFYRSLQSGALDENVVRDYLTEEGQQLLEEGEAYYYEVRDRFNAKHQSLDFLFLNRACFNGVMRFNRKGGFNVPFCRKPERFTPAYVTRICNQVSRVSRLIQQHDWTFEVSNWEATLCKIEPDDFLYCDPPYIGRHSDYFNRWSERDAIQLAERVQQLSGGYAVSMWLQNRYRRNSHVESEWERCHIREFAHFYHVGSTENLRNEMVEALIIKPHYQSAEKQKSHVLVE